MSRRDTKLDKAVGKAADSVANVIAKLVLGGFAIIGFIGGILRFLSLLRLAVWVLR